MKILLAAGVFYPDVGGPAIHVFKIAERLSMIGLNPVVVAYGDDPGDRQYPFVVKRVSRRYAKIWQWFFYLALIIKEGWNAQVIYAFDPTAAGIPACLVAKFFRKPFLIRVGGDPIWERVVESGKRLMPITDYYDQGLFKIDKPILFRLIKTILEQADRVVLYNQFFKDFYIKYFGVKAAKIEIVKNPVFRREVAEVDLSADPILIFAGRFVAYKNLPLTMKAFDAVRQKIGRGRFILIGKGPDQKKLEELQQSLPSKESIKFVASLPQEQLFEEIKRSAVAIGPALSEFNPNFILESLSFGKPVLLSRGHGLSVDLPTEFVFDPLDQAELEAKLLALFDPEQYRQAVNQVSNLDLSQSWDKVLDFHEALIKQIINGK